MAAGSIIIDLLMRTGSFETDTARATKAAQKRFKELSQDAYELGRVVGTAFTAASAAIAYMAKQTVDGLDKLNDAADATGATVENLSALEDVAARNGESFDTVTGVLVKFNNALKEADGKNGVSQALKMIGLDAEALKKIDPAEALRQTAVALAGFSDDGNKARIVQELFGKSIREAAPFLKDLSEQGQLNATATKEQAQQAETFNKHLFAMQKNILDASRSITGNFLPALNEVLKAYNEGGLIAGINKIGNTLFNWEENQLRKPINALKAEIAALKESSGAITFDVFGQKGKLEAEIASKTAALKKLEDAFYKITNLQGGRGVVNPALADTRPVLGSLPGPPKGPDKGPDKVQLTEAEKYLEGLRKQLDKTKELTVEQQLLADIEAGRLGVVLPERQSELVSIAKQIDAAKALGIAFNEQAATEKQILANRKAASDEGKRIYEETRTPLEKLNAEQYRLNMLLQQGTIDWDTYSRAIFEASDAFDKTVEKIEPIVEKMDEFSKRAAENIQDALGEGLFDILKGNFDNIGDRFKDMILRMIAEAQAAKIARALFGDLVAGGDGKGLVGEALGTFGKFLFGGGKAGGGDVMARTSYLVGENGPEMFVPRSAGAIIPNGRTMGASGGDTYVFHGQNNRGELIAAVQTARALAGSDAYERRRRGAPA